jgi:hypothetical protein
LLGGTDHLPRYQWSQPVVPGFSFQLHEDRDMTTPSSFVRGHTESKHLAWIYDINISQYLIINYGIDKMVINFNLYDLNGSVVL